MECGLLLDVVVAESAAVLELLASKDQTLLIGRDANCLIRVEYWESVMGNPPFLVLDLCLDIVDCVRGLNFKSDGFARKAGFINEN